MAKRDIGYDELRQRLVRVGVDETTENLTNKINRGKFSAIFLLRCLAAIECKVLRISDE